MLSVGRRADCSFIIDSWKKMSLDKSLQIHAKSWKILLNPANTEETKGCYAFNNEKSL